MSPLELLIEKYLKEKPSGFGDPAVDFEAGFKAGCEFSAKRLEEVYQDSVRSKTTLKNDDGSDYY